MSRSFSGRLVGVALIILSITLPHVASPSRAFAADKLFRVGFSYLNFEHAARTTAASATLLVDLGRTITLTLPDLSDRPLPRDTYLVVYALVGSDLGDEVLGRAFGRGRIQMVARRHRQSGGVRPIGRDIVRMSFFSLDQTDSFNFLSTAIDVPDDLAAGDQIEVALTFYGKWMLPASGEVEFAAGWDLGQAAEGGRLSSIKERQLGDLQLEGEHIEGQEGRFAAAVGNRDLGGYLRTFRVPVPPIEDPPPGAELELRMTYGNSMDHDLRTATTVRWKPTGGRSQRFARFRGKHEASSFGGHSPELVAPPTSPAAGR